MNIFLNIKQFFLKILNIKSNKKRINSSPKNIEELLNNKDLSVEEIIKLTKQNSQSDIKRDDISKMKDKYKTKVKPETLIMVGCGLGFDKNNNLNYNK